MDRVEFAVGMRQRDGVTVLDLRGQIDAAANQDLSDAYVEASDSGSGTLLLNFGETTYINSTGIALLVGLLARARAERQRVIACGLSDHYREIFEITRLADFISLAEDEETAVERALAGVERSR
jgi:anti-sigma B factor antagonist